ncbi:S-adenosylmethionine:tRNA ribosyltransferase-isomerase [Frankliniella fusca]|uniref:S-adenosylmethionine:tRNA ribosyltransferase-isomerase n=1 Tax=Frankliniella fusca TaxID=407009 RepID=A0AAE1LCV3_9NEOP|nr:S-adenosylmethionine:tRNA ribosyltransferase-isomerase [Frankliniella fusca]
MRLGGIQVRAYSRAKQQRREGPVQKRHTSIPSYFSTRREHASASPPPPSLPEYFKVKCAVKKYASRIYTLYSGSCTIPQNSSPNPHNRLSSAAETWLAIQLCADKETAKCGCSFADYECTKKCSYNSRCACGGYKLGKSTTITVQKCISTNKCYTAEEKCIRKCSVGDPNCGIKCKLDTLACECKCNGSVGLQSTLGLTLALIALWLLQATKLS